MVRYSKALCWAMSILLVALGNRLHLIDDSIAQTLLIVLPIAAVTALRGGAGCRIAQRRAGA